MTPRTIFLSRLIGLYCLLIGLAMISHKDATVSAVSAFYHSAPALMLAGVIALILGLALVLGHNVWTGGVVPVLVTLTGWISLLKGLLLLFFTPDSGATIFEQLHYADNFFAYMAITLALGAILTYGGFRPGKPRA